jgi:predicted Zn-dependent peptidase
MRLLTLISLILLMSAPTFAAETKGDKMSELEKMGAIVEKDPKMPQIISYTLKNGLRILMLEKHFSPVISFNLTFKAGNVDNEQGKTGIAHMAEHMAFKGTKTINTLNYKKEKVILEKIEKANQELTLEKSKKNRDEEKIKQLEIDFRKLQKEADKYIIKNEYTKIYTELGSSRMNAGTSTDYTTYMISLPSNRLEDWMMIESDRFKNPVLREFYMERDVVMEEKRRSDSNPSSILWETLFSHAFVAHPYKNPTLGWKDDLKKFSATDAKNFFGKFYAPNNATLAIVGDINPKEVIKLAKKYFSSWKSKDIPSTDYTKEPKQKAENRIDVFFKAQPEIRMGFHNDGFDSPDMPALIVLSEVLSGGKTGRFYKTIVEGRKIALYAASHYSLMGNRYPSLFVIWAAPKKPHTSKEVETAIMEEIEKVKKEAPSAWEMDRIINNYEADLIKQLESNPGMAQNLSSSQQILGDWKIDWIILEKIKKLKPEDISKAAKKYLTKENKTIVFLRMPEKK